MKPKVGELWVHRESGQKVQITHADGELIGIVVAKSSGTDVEGLGFAIPINDVKTILTDLMTYGYVEGRIDLKMTLQDVTGVYSYFYGYSQAKRIGTTRRRNGGN